MLEIIRCSLHYARYCYKLDLTCSFSSCSLWWPVPAIPSCIQEVFQWNWTPALRSRDTARRTWLCSAGETALGDILRSWIGHSRCVGNWGTAIQVSQTKACLWMRAIWSLKEIPWWSESPGKSWARLGLCSLAQEGGRASGRCDETSAKHALLCARENLTLHFECCQCVFSSSCICQNWSTGFYFASPGLFVPTVCSY